MWDARDVHSITNTVDKLSLRRHEDGSSSQQSNFQQAQGTVLSRVVCLDFPRYDGIDDPITWIDWVEQFFEFHKTLGSEKVALAAYHLEGGLQLWFQSIRKTQVWITWEGFKQALNDLYRPTLLDDFYGDLTKLTHIGSVRDYLGQFGRLLASVGSLIE